MKHGLEHFVERRKISADDKDFLRVSKQIVEATQAARESKQAAPLKALAQNLAGRFRRLRHLCHCLAELIDFIARDGRPPPQAAPG